MNVDVFAQARAAGRGALLEHEGLDLLASWGVSTPRYAFIEGVEGVEGVDLEALPGDRVVLKVSSAQILHKSDVGGVKIVTKARAALSEAVSEMAARLADHPIDGFLITEFVPFSPALGHELLLGARYTPDFGPVITFGPGGIYTELLASSFEPGKGVAVLSPDGLDAAQVEAALDGLAIAPLMFGGLRGQEAKIERAAVVEMLLRFAEGAAALIPEQVAELEINPLVLHDGRLVALDALCTLTEEAPAKPRPRPVHKLHKLLKPQSVAVIGVSEKPTPGHIIVKNLLREGFEAERLYIIKPGRDEMFGCPCVPDVAALPERVDLFVVTINAAQTPGLIEALIEHEKAESIIVIPGGLGETEASKPLVERMNAALAASREAEWQGPVINGGNCLGVRSKPGRYDTMFIPAYKLPPTGEVTTPLALISQSGALAVSRASALAHLNPRYILSIGNQMDLTAGDYLTHLAEDPEVEVFACYVEGFKPGDGQRWLAAARRIVASGREVVLYRAGRTAAGQQATASHTASVAGDYAVARALAEAAGVKVAESLTEFEDLTRTLTLLRGKPLKGDRVAAISNAGFECVGIADNLTSLKLGDFGPEAHAALEALFERYRLKGLVEVHNPLDLTPMLGDEGYEAIIKAALDDPNIDAAVVGVVPLTPALNSLAPAEGHREDLRQPDAIAGRLSRLFAESIKPWVVVLDGGELYDPLYAALDEAGVPTFRSVDRATRALDRLARG